jgi:hypothetical protein
VRPESRRGPEERVAFSHSGPDRAIGTEDEPAVAGHETRLE